MAEDVGTVYALDIKDALDSFDRLGAADAQFRAAATQSGQAASNSFALAAKAATDYSDRLAGATGEQRAAQAATRDVMRAVQELTQANRELAIASRNANSGAEYQRLQGLIAQNTAKIREAKQAILENKLATEQERTAVLAVVEARRQETNQTKLAAAAAKDAAAATKQGGAESGGFFSGLLGKITAAGAGLVAFSALYGRVQQGLQDFAAISGVQATFRAVAGGALEGAKAFAFVKEQSAALGLELVPTAKAYAQLFTAAKEANLPVAETERLFKGVTSAAKVLNLSQAETEQALKAVQQMLSKGTVSSEELRRQLGNALPGAFGLAAKAAGLTTAEFNKQLAAGKILANDFLPKFSRQLQLTYGAGTAEAATNVRANLGRINTFFSEQSALVGDLFAPLVAGFARFVSGATGAAKTAESTSAAYYTQAEAVRQLGRDLPTLLGRYDSLSSSTSTNKNKQEELRTVIDQIAAAVPGAVTAFDKYGKALGINAGAVAAFLKTNRALGEELRQVAVREGQENLTKLLAQQKQLQNGLNGGELVNGLRRFRAPSTVSIQGAAAREVVTPGALLSQAESDKRLKGDAARAAQVGASIAAQRAALEDLRRQRKTASDENGKDTAAQTGLIEALQKKIKELTEQREKSTEVLDVRRLTTEIKAAQKELDALLGKEEKVRKGRESKLGAALKALEAERATLTNLAEKASVKEADGARERSKAQFEEELRQIELIKQRLIERERAVRRAGGRGNGADGLIDRVQQAQLDALTTKAANDRLDRDFATAKKRVDFSISLRADSDAQERLLLLRKYEEERRLVLDNEEDKFQLKAKYLRDVAALEFAINKRNSEAEADYNRSNASRAVGEVFGAGTGISIIEARRSEKQLLLEIEAKSAQDQINNAAYLEDKLKKGEIEAGLARLARIKNQLNELEQEKAKHGGEDFAYKLLFGENDSEQLRAQFEQTAAVAIGTINQILSAQLAAEQQKISQRERNIVDLQSQLAAEIQLNKDGAASNIAGIREQIEAEKIAKRAALAESRRIAKQQQMVNDLQAVSSIGLAVANIIAGWSTVPLAGSILGIAAAAATVASFVATKATAGAAARTQDSFFIGGYTGDGDARQTSTAIGARPYEYHRREYVMPHDITDQYRYALLEPLHQGKPLDWSAPHMQALLPDYELPGRLRAEQAAGAQHHYHLSTAPMRDELRALRLEVEKVTGNTSRISDKTVTALSPTKVFVIDGAGNEKTINL